MRPHNILLLIIASATLANATSLGVGPGELTFKNANRGAYYIGHLTASTNDQTLPCTITATGDTADWITFDSNTFTITKDGQYTIPIRLNVPETTPNGRYSGIIEIRSNPNQQGAGGSGMNVGAAIYIKNTVEVTGVEETWFRVLRVSAASTKEGDPIKTEVTVKNNAGTAIKPLITLKAISQDKQKTYATSSLSRETVEPQTRGIITTYIPSTDMKPGLYFMDFNINIDGQELWTSQEPFYVVPAETTEQPNIKISTVLDDATVSNSNLTLGETLTIKARYHNAGDVPLDAKIRADFIKDGKIISSEEGKIEYINSGEAKETQLKNTPQEAGDYTVRIWVEYAGRRTAVREARIKVWSFSPPVTSFDINFYIIVIPAALLIILWIVYFYKKYYSPEE
jgi:hypothetical protein